MKLWQKENTQVSELIEKFTVGRDKEFDIYLAEADVKGSLAHAEMLHKQGMLEEADWQKIQNGLDEILSVIREGKFSIDPGVEDVHSQVEWMLTQKIGEAGKRIHSGRSRNDQVAVDLKLFLKDRILLLKDQVKEVFDQLIDLSEKHKADLLPGYTHLQLAMPSSFGLWFGAYAESLSDDLEILAASFAITNKNPLGSGAGYGSSFPLNRELTTELLGFEGMHVNSVYAQMSRGKTERAVAAGSAAIAATLARLSMDTCLYLNQHFNFISFPAELTTGSSLMPHKKNPDVFELIRAKCNRIQSIPNELALLLTNLPSGYHRDLQLTKEILFPALEELGNCLQLLTVMFSRIEIRKDILKDEFYKYLFSVEAVNEHVNKGVPFRDAYRIVGNQIEKGTFHFDVSKPLQHTHTGSLGNLRNDLIREAMDKVLNKF